MRQLALVLAASMLSAPSNAADEDQYQTLEWALHGQRQFGMQAEIHMRSYINGFRNGYLSMYITQELMDGDSAPEGSEAVETLIDCMFLKDDLATIYDRMIEAAVESPAMLVMTWLRKDFEEQCGDELSAILELEED